MAIQNFRDLHVWQLGRKIGGSIYQITRSFPKEEMFGLSNQMRRATISITSNIAEGFYRFQKKDFQRFLSIALGSCAELESQIEISFDLGFVEHLKKDAILKDLHIEVKMLKSLIGKTGING